VVAATTDENRRRRTFAELYPNVARWVRGYGWIELGDDLPGPAFVLALDEGGIIWAGEATYPTVDDALQALDAALATWLREQFGV
jgi:hypothetical protein